MVEDSGRKLITHGLTPFFSSLAEVMSLLLTIGRDFFSIVDDLDAKLLKSKANES